MTRSLFQLDDRRRKLHISRGEFYLEQAKSRLLHQFDNIEKDADRAADKWLADNAHRFDPDVHDSSDFEQAAYDESIAFYDLLTQMKTNSELSVFASIYHQWDKDFRSWIAREMRHWAPGETTELAIWSLNIGQIVDFFKDLGWDIRCKPYYKHLDVSRMVVNVYKHGEGKSFNDLKQHHPQYIRKPLFNPQNLDNVDYAYLQVSEQQIESLGLAVRDFWLDVPADILEPVPLTLPKWLTKTISG